MDRETFVRKGIEYIGCGESVGPILDSIYSMLKEPETNEDAKKYFDMAEMSYHASMKWEIESSEQAVANNSSLAPGINDNSPPMKHGHGPIPRLDEL